MLDKKKFAKELGFVSTEAMESVLQEWVNDLKMLDLKFADTHFLSVEPKEKNDAYLAYYTIIMRLDLLTAFMESLSIPVVWTEEVEAECALREKRDLEDLELDRDFMEKLRELLKACCAKNKK